MPRLNTQGKTLKRVLEWQIDRNITDAELASALKMPPATYSRRKDADDFPTFEELNRIGDALHVNPRWLQVEFGYLSKDELANHVTFEIAHETFKSTHRPCDPRDDGH
jgi:transcriptional regulator with XRE-family HTH domain